MKPENIHMREDWLLCEPLTFNEKTEGGLHLPDRDDSPGGTSNRFARIRMAGPDASLNRGDVIMVGSFGVEAVIIQGVAYVYIREKSIVATVDADVINKAALARLK